MFLAPEPIFEQIVIDNRNSRDQMNGSGRNSRENQNLSILVPEQYMRRPACRQYFARCEEYLVSLNFPDELRIKHKDMCYCKSCLATDNQEKCREKTKSRATSSLCDGWAQFSLATRFPRDRYQWPICFYGVRHPEYIADIVGNTKFDSHNGKVVTSPSIRYAANKNFSPKQIFHASDGNHYKAQIVIKCRQQPNRFAAQPRIYVVKDLPDPNELLHWLSDAASLYMCAIMLRLTKN